MPSPRNGQVRWALLCAAVIVSSACTGPAPTAECVAGGYVLNTSPSVRLVLDAGGFSLTANGESVTGAYSYDALADVSDEPPGQGGIEFFPREGELSSANKEAIWAEAGSGDSLRLFLDSMRSDRRYGWPVFDEGGVIYIELDPDPPIRFTKDGCR